ncbi:Secretion system apparatus protein SsaV [Sodalis praecaptivus]
MVTSVDARRFLRRIIETFRHDIPVLSWQELGTECEIQVLAALDLSAEELVVDDL